MNPTDKKFKDTEDKIRDAERKFNLSHRFWLDFFKINKPEAANTAFVDFSKRRVTGSVRRLSQDAETVEIFFNPDFGLESKIDKDPIPFKMTPETLGVDSDKLGAIKSFAKSSCTGRTPIKK